MAMKLKSMGKARKHVKWNIDNLKQRANDFKEYVDKRITTTEERDVEKRWENMKNLISQAAKTVVGYQKREIAKNHGLQKKCLTRWRSKDGGRT